MNKLLQSNTPKKLFTYYKTSQYTALFWVIFISTLISTPVLHFLLMQWHEWIAWIVTGLTIYGLIWLYIDYRAIKHNPITLLDNILHIRIGKRWKADVALSNIKNIESFVSEEMETKYTELTILNEKNIFIDVHSPIEIEGTFGIMKRTSKIALYVDEPSLFIKHLSTPPTPPSNSLASAQQETHTR